MLSEFALPILGFGDEQSPPLTVMWRDGTVLCRAYGGILGGYPEPETPPDNVVSFAEYKEQKKWQSEGPSSPDDPNPEAV